MTDAEIDLLELVVKGADRRRVEDARMAVLQERLTPDRKAMIERAFDAEIDAFRARCRITEGLPQAVFFVMQEEAEARARIRHGDI